MVNAEDLTEGILLQIMDSITKWIYQKSGIEFFSKYQKVEIFENIDKRRVAQVRLYYKGPITPSSPRAAPRIKLDLTSGECLTDTPVVTKIYHPYSDLLSFNPQTLCYSFNEIFAEKLRAFVERCRPRDIYDIVHCFKSKSPNVPDLQKVAVMFKQKCEAKNINSITEEVLLKQLKESKPFWDEQLAHQITNLKPYDDFADKAMEVMRFMLREW